MTLELNANTVAEYLEYYRDVPGIIAVTALYPGSGTGPTKRCVGVDAALEAVKAFDREGTKYAGTYIRGTTLLESTPLLNDKGNDARGGNIHSAYWVMHSLDVDYRAPGKSDKYPAGETEARKLIADSGLPEPTFFVYSGNGCYPKWLYSEPVEHREGDRDGPAELQADIYRALGAYFESQDVELDTGIKDAARIWRTPGTPNRKNKDDVKATGRSEETGPRYTFEELRNAVPRSTWHASSGKRAAKPGTPEQVAALKGRLNRAEACDKVATIRDKCLAAIPSIGAHCRDEGMKVQWALTLLAAEGHPVGDALDQVRAVYVEHREPSSGRDPGDEWDDLLSGAWVNAAGDMSADARLDPCDGGVGLGIEIIRQPDSFDKVAVIIGRAGAVELAKHAGDRVAVVALAGRESWKRDGVPVPELRIVKGKDVVIITGPDVVSDRSAYDSATELEDACLMKGAGGVTYGRPGGVSDADLLTWIATLNDTELDHAVGSLLESTDEKPCKTMPGKKSTSTKLAIVSPAGQPLFNSDGSLKVKALANTVDGLFPGAVGREPFRVALYMNGVFRLDPEAYMGVVAYLLGDEFRSGHAAEAEKFAASTLRLVGQKELPEHASEPLVNLKNGMLDLRTGQLLPHDPGYLSSVQLPVAWDPEATCRVYDKWLTTQLPDQWSELEEAASQMLDPSRTPSRAIFLFGPSRSGKSTYLRILQAIAGRSNISGVSLHQLIDNRFASAEVYGKILNSDADLKSSHVEDMSLFKKMTGEDLIHADKKHGRQFSFTSRALFAFSANDLPTVGETSKAYTARIAPFKWGKSFLGEDDPKYERQMIDRELSGILVRLVKAWQRQAARGRYAPVNEKVRQEFERASNRVAMWVAERCTITPDGNKLAASGMDPAATMSTTRTLLHGFNEWAKESGGASMTLKTFKAKLETVHGVQDARSGNRTRGFNVTIRPSATWGEVADGDDDSAPGRSDDGPGRNEVPAGKSAGKSCPAAHPASPGDMPEAGKTGKSDLLLPTSRKPTSESVTEGNKGMCAHRAGRSSQELPVLPGDAAATPIAPVSGATVTDIFTKFDPADPDLPDWLRDDVVKAHATPITGDRVPCPSCAKSIPAGKYDLHLSRCAQKVSAS